MNRSHLPLHVAAVVWLCLCASLASCGSTGLTTASKTPTAFPTRFAGSPSAPTVPPSFPSPTPTNPPGCPPACPPAATPTFTPIPTSPPLGAARINAVDASLYVSPAGFNSSNWTYSARIKLDNPHAGSAGMMSAGDACSYWDFTFGIHSNGTLNVVSTSTGAEALGATVIDTNEHLYTMTYDGSNVKVYVDSNYEMQIPATTSITLPIALGNYDSSCAPSALGTYRDAKWWNVALSSSDVSSLASGSVPRSNSLVARWPLSNDARDVLNGHDFSLKGNVTFV
jgi:hypothetical protein